MIQRQLTLVEIPNRFRGAEHNPRLKPAKLTKRSFKILLSLLKKQVIVLQKLKQRAWRIP